MMLNTTIQPRKDGTVRATGPSGQVYEFTATPPAGELCAEVAEPGDVAHLLETGNFFPADEADFELALSLVKPGQDVNAADNGQDKQPPPERSPAPPPIVPAPPLARPPARKKAAR